MRITSPRDLGLYIRDSRRRTGQTQWQLAAAAKVSRRWLSDVEAGKPTAEIGLVFRTLGALGLILDAQPEQLAPDQVDLDEHLRRLGESRPDTDGAGGRQ
jgi:transcriptional regulator with XRE-family HTH domain